MASSTALAPPPDAGTGSVFSSAGGSESVSAWVVVGVVALGRVVVVVGDDDGFVVPVVPVVATFGAAVVVTADAAS